MEQEIVIKVPIYEEKSKSKAMKRASKMKGVTKVEVVREKNHLVVTGVGVDSVELTQSLRKIFCFAHIVSVKGRRTTAPQCETSMEETGFTEDDFRHQIFYNYPTQSYYQPSYNYVAVPVHDPDPPRICSIM